MRQVMKVLRASALVSVWIGCSPVPPDDEPLPKIHPEVFSLVECWLSDTAQPVATEINLDAVRQNTNQFYGAVYANGEWTCARGADGRSWSRYRQLSREGSSVVVEFQHNGGGTLTTKSKIGFTLDHRTIEVDGEPMQVPVMRVDSLR